jgi:hypothetical protein
LAGAAWAAAAAAEKRAAAAGRIQQEVASRVAEELSRCINRSANNALLAPATEVGPGTVGSPVIPGPRDKELSELSEANYRLARRVNSLENARVSMGCAKASLLAMVLFTFVTAVLVGSVLVLAYAEHRLDVPVFTRLVGGR